MEVKKYFNYSIDEDFILIYEINLAYLDLFLGLTKAFEKDYLNKTGKSLIDFGFIKENNEEILKNESFFLKRFLEIGDGKTGELNNICDVPFVSVGHATVHENDYHTGITIISAHQGNIFNEKVVASSYVFNGFAKAIGISQIEELGNIETDIVLTSTLNSFKVADFLVSNVLDSNSEVGYKTSTVNPVVLECNDGELNKARDRILTKSHFDEAYLNRRKLFKQGAYGAGSGMICHGFKGGIGSSSRIIILDERKYTIGVLVNSNYGTIDNFSFLDTKKHYNETIEKGSITIVMATDIPLTSRQIKRVLKRMAIGIGRTGTYSSNGSGDIFVGFSNAFFIKHVDNKAISTVSSLHESYISRIFKLVVEATHEAVLNSLFNARPISGYQKSVTSLNQEILDSLENYIDKLKIIRSKNL